MKNQPKIVRVVLYLLVIMVLSFSIAGSIFALTGFSFINEGVEYILDEEYWFDIQNIQDIIIDNTNHKVRIIPAEDEKVRVHLNGKLVASSDAYIPELVFTETSTSLKIEVKKLSIKTFMGFYSTNVSLDVYLPVSFEGNMDLRTSSGRVEIDELNLNEFKYKSSSGSLTAKSISAVHGAIITSSGRVSIQSAQMEKLKVQTSSGNIEIDKIISEDVSLTGSSARITIGQLDTKEIKHSTSSGNLDIGNVKMVNGEFDSSSGRLTFNDVTGNLQATSRSGNISIKYNEYNSNIKIQTSSGRVDLVLPAEAAFLVDARTSSGRIRLDFDVTVNGEMQDKNVVGSVGNGTNKVDIRTSSGNINISK